MANFLGEVLLAKGATTFEELTDTLRNLDSKISTLKLSAVQSLNSTFALDETDLERVTQWYTEIVEIQNQLEALENQLGKDKQVLSSANQDLDGIKYDLETCNESIRLLRALVGVVRNYERVDTGDYYHAAQLIKTSELELTDMARDYPSAEDHVWLKQLKIRFSDLVVDVYDSCRKEWSNLFQFDKNSLTIYPHEVNVEYLVKSLKNIKSFDRIWDKFLNSIWQELFKPSCARDYKIEVLTPKTQGKQAKSRDGSLLDGSQSLNDMRRTGGITIRAKKLDKPFNNATEVFQNILELVKVLDSIFCTCKEEMYFMSDFIGPKIDSELSNKYLKALILERCNGDMDKARGDVGKMIQFVEILSSDYDFNFPKGNVFETIAENFDRMFQNYIKEALVVKIRDLIKADIHNTVEIKYESVPNSRLSAEEIVLLRKNPALFPKCVVSKSVADIISLLKDHMQKYPKDVTMSASVFSLYLALVKIPNSESDAGDMVPLTSVLIHNNSYYLAHHAGYTFGCNEKVLELRTRASQAISFMMRCIRSNLNELITTAMSSIEERVDRKIDITHDFLVIVAELKRLDKIMTSVFTSVGWKDILATLVDHTVNEICSKVLAWDDIPANSANELASAFSQFAVATSSLFQEDASTQREIEALTARAVKKWQRFRLLIFVLTASMKEIETKWVGGCGPLANEYTSEEVRRLVRALFQNTDRRAEFLATIK